VFTVAGFKKTRLRYVGNDAKSDVLASNLKFIISQICGQSGNLITFFSGPLPDSIITNTSPNQKLSRSTSFNFAFAFKKLSAL
jgi:hypothetical protein